MKTMLKTIDWWKVIGRLALIVAGLWGILAVCAMWALAHAEFDQCLLNGAIVFSIGGLVLGLNDRGI